MNYRRHEGMMHEGMMHERTCVRARRSAVIPDNLVRLMSPADRAALGVETSAEAAARGEARREAELQKQVERWLMLHGIEYLHLSPRAREKAGWPDLVFAVQGQAVAVELKTATGMLSEAQEACLARLQADGWRVAVCRSVPDVVALVTGLGSDVKVLPGPKPPGDPCPNTTPPG